MDIDLLAGGNMGPLIPGAYERNTLTYRQRGALGADPLAARLAGSSSMDATTIEDRKREGGGAPSQRGKLHVRAPRGVR
jgi:hypothetical protein